MASTSIACYDSDNIYYRGNDGYLQCYRYNGTSWVHEYLGSSLDPSIRKVSNNPNSIVVVNGVVYYRGHDNLIHYYKYDGSLWNYSFINIRNSENKVKDNLKLGYNGKLFYLGQDNKIHYFEKLGVVWTQGSIYSNLWFDPYIYSYFDVSLSENKIFYSNDDDHVFNLYYETCENLNPPCITDEFGECVPIEACLGMYKEFSDILLTDNIINNNEIIIYPNPATSYIKVNNIERKAEQLNNYYYKIMTPSGGIISDGILAEQNIIDVSELETGIYFLFIDNNANRMIKSFLKIN
ncbi:MAG: T9SS type A sorting domain-containing protein [Bacteroidetes bacterium]|nr:T9SS type A sorting domain-containing protein [Bacteroidota bacterium]